MEASSSFHLYDIASKARDVTARLQIGDAVAVASLNSDFYRAFRNMDENAITRAWFPCNNGSVTCTHLGRSFTRGHSNIMQVWNERLWFRVEAPSRLACSVKGSSAWITSLGNIIVPSAKQSLRFRRQMAGEKILDGINGSVGEKRGKGNHLKNFLGDTSSFQIHSTNIFRKVDGLWLLVHYHASLVPSSHTYSDNVVDSFPLCPPIREKRSGSFFNSQQLRPQEKDFLRQETDQTRPPSSPQTRP